jgi:hypothetical protein
MKTIKTMLLFLLPCLFALQGTVHGQQGQSGNTSTVERQAGKGFILQFGNPSEVNAAAAKERGFIRLDGPLDEETRIKLRGQSIKFHTGSDGGYYIEILNPDSVESMNRNAFEALANGAKPAGLPVDPAAELKAFAEQSKSERFEELPVRIRTEAQSDNHLEIIVENRTGHPLTNVLVTPNHMPNEWQTWPKEHKADGIPAYGSDSFFFRLEVPATPAPEQIGFQISSSEYVTSWSARVHPASSESEQIPEKFELHGNYPNPFNPATTISYSLPEAMQVSVEVYNLIGQRVAVLVNTRQNAGTHNVVWDAASAASGTYIYRVTGIGESGRRVFEERSLTLIK